MRTARLLGSTDPKGINMTVQSESERNKAVVNEYFKAGVQGDLTSFAAHLHPDFHSNRAQLPSLGRSTRRGSVLP
jgi:hypothetical protein